MTEPVEATGPKPKASLDSEQAATSSEDDEKEDEGPRPRGEGWPRALALCAATFVSMLYAGASMKGIEVDSLGSLLAGWDFAIPLLSILVCHELGHYVVGQIRGVDISPPYFIPLPIGMLGTMGAVIRMRGRIKTRDALFDVGAAGPYAGLAVALPVLIYGIVTSPVTPLPEDPNSFIIEGRSLLYTGLLYALKGPFPEGQDIFLTPTAFAGWAGLMVTMMNLLPVGQLDGGHVAYALLGERHHRLARAVLIGLPVVAVVTGLYYGGMAHLAGYPSDSVESELFAGLHWMVWFGMLTLIAVLGVAPLPLPDGYDALSIAAKLKLRVQLFTKRVLLGHQHPPTDDQTLSKGRRAAAWATLVLFVLLFMPFWMRTPPSYEVAPAGAAADAADAPSEAGP